MSKIIYMDSTIRFIHSKDPAYAQEIINSGVTVDTNDKPPYLKIND